MKRDKVIFGFISCKPIESTDCDIAIPEPTSIKRPKSTKVASALLNHDVMKSPITRYCISIFVKTVQI